MLENRDHVILYGDEREDAIKVDANVKNDFTDQLSHEICMGIRYGLFGSNAPDSSSLNDGLYAVAESIQNLADSVEKLYQHGMIIKEKEKEEV